MGKLTELSPVKVWYGCECFERVGCETEVGLVHPVQLLKVDSRSQCYLQAEVHGVCWMGRWLEFQKYRLLQKQVHC